jgi:hypothetical protein
MRLFPAGSPVRVRTDSKEHPLAFVWLGETHGVRSLEDTREPLLDWWAPEGEVHRLYYLVVTERNLICELYQDLVTGSWQMSRVFD